jgi:CRISPR-associated protein Csc2
MNKRYGAATSRIGRVQNHILGIYYGKEEGPANLILSKEVARLLARESEELNSENLNKIIYSPVIDVAKVKELVKQVFEEDIQALDIQSLDQNKVNDLLAYVTTDTLKAALERQKKTASEFFEAVNQEQ